MKHLGEKIIRPVCYAAQTGVGYITSDGDFRGMPSSSNVDTRS
jgi:hypothetical protein